MFNDKNKNQPCLPRVIIVREVQDSNTEAPIYNLEILQPSCLGRQRETTMVSFPRTFKKKGRSPR